MISLSITDKKFVNQIDERNLFPDQICVGHHRVHPITCVQVTCYCLTLNGRMIFIKAYSIDKITRSMFISIIY